MLAIVHTRASLGVSAPAVTVEVHLSGGLPALSIVGLPETGVREKEDLDCFETVRRGTTIGASC